ncbi:Phosphorylase kinase, gamma catalytic subunit [Parasponia andersonii]|uniref:non-specific serine/threonine protein kinase n=1 Tax=Parasponia andersonii TaxID=3476 RepID=A0A2P5CHT5_PARAD|nr:Phosphorylase kinase, gamma catalytic subunit [Parasponia andersonii]
MGDTESRNSRAVDLSSTQNRQHRQKVHIYNKVLRRLVDLNLADPMIPGFEDELWTHFYRLPTGYALDVNMERAQDVLMHKRLLQLAYDPATRPAMEVRPVQVHFASGPAQLRRVETQCIHPPPAFDLSPDFRLALEANQLSVQNWDHNMNCRPMHEITISTNDKPKLFCQLTSLLSDIGLNIQEAHAFSTIDGYSLDVFLVDGWAHEETEQLKVALAKKILRIEKHPRLNYLISPVGEQKLGMKLISNHADIPNDAYEVRDIDLSLLKFERKIASGSFGDLYKGTFYNQDVAIKVLRTEHLNETMQREFAQEVDIMRKVQHKNVVQFIGASTRPPSLCIVTEFMSGGSVYDFMKQSGVLPLQSVLRVAIDVSKGMNYLHQNNIIHRDLKAANLLMDENALPYENLTPLQAAVGVVHEGLRPTIQEHTNPVLVELMERCWQKEPTLRPQFSEVLEILQRMSKKVSDTRVGKQKEKASQIVPAFIQGRKPGAN